MNFTPSVRRLARALALAALAAAASPGAQAQRPSQLVIGQLQFLPNSHPLIQVNNTKLFLMGFVQRPITAFDARGQSVCILCAVKPSLENGLAKIVPLPDGRKGMTVTIQLRPDVRWGDGTPVSAKDIAFTWKMATEGSVAFSNYNSWRRATRLDVVDARTVVLHLPKVETGYDTWDQVLPEHLEGPIYAKYRTTEDYSRQSLYNREPTNPGLWNGAYTVATAKLGTEVVLVANKYWPQQPHIQRVILSYRGSATALAQSLLAGDIDALPVSPGGISFAQMLTLRKDHADRFNFPIEPGYNLERLAFQLKNPVLADVRVRKAIALAIDRDAIANRLFEKVVPVATSLLLPTNANYSGAVARYPFDPQRARALMAEAGWKPGPDGICAKAGQRAAFDILTTAGNQTRLQIAQVIQNELKAICIATNVKQVPISIFNGQEMRRRNFNGISLSSIQFPPSASPGLLLGSNAIPDQHNGWTGNNFSGYANPAMDAAVSEADGSLDPARAKTAWAKIQRIALDDLPILPLYFYPAAWVVPKDTHGFDVARFDQPTNWAEHWTRDGR